MDRSLASEFRVSLKRLLVFRLQGVPSVLAVGNSSVPAGHWVHHDGVVYTPLTLPTDAMSTHQQRQRQAAAP